MTDPFPLDQWFDTTRKISKPDADLAEAQMALYAVKENMNPDSKEARKQYEQMRKAVKDHNRKFARR